MVRSHAKNNTTQSIFSYHERTLLDYGTKKQRIGADSMKKIDACCLCLGKVQGDAVCCGDGHLFCKECILNSRKSCLPACENQASYINNTPIYISYISVPCSSLHTSSNNYSVISQKSQIKSHQAQLQAHIEQEALEKLQARQTARARVLKDFERGLGLGIGGRRTITSSGGGLGTNGAKEDDKEKVSTTASTTTSTTANATPKLITASEESGEESGGSGEKKRKFDFDESMVEKLAKEAEEVALKRIEAEQAEARRAKLPAFWLPSLAPEASIGPLKDVKLQTLCSAGEFPHNLTMKQLLPVIFTYPSSSSSTSTSFSNASPPICPSCSRELSNGVKTVLLSSTTPLPSASTNEPPAKKSKSNPEKGKDKSKDKDKEVRVCGHVICSQCCETIVKPGKPPQCPVCEAIINTTAKEKLGKGEVQGIMELVKEGTGFAAAGGAEATKVGLAFRI